MSDSLSTVANEVIECRQCPRLVAWREDVAVKKRPMYKDWEYWGKPVPGFGDPGAKLLVIGLAPAAHGGNRTGRIFTGDRSGDWLYRALHRAAFASQPTSIDRNDGMELHGAYITAAVHCAPPANQPTDDERDACLPYLRREMALLSGVRVIVCLGGYAYQNISRFLALTKRPQFRHGLEVPLPDEKLLLCSFHPSQQNTFTGRLTEVMLDSVFSRAREIIDGEPSPTT